MTKEFIATTVNKSKYWRPGEQTIGNDSVYGDDVWNFAGSTMGQTKKHRRINWKAYKNGPLSLTDPRFENLLEEMKCLAWTLVFDRSEGAMLKEGSISRMAVGFQDLMSWMMERGHVSFSSITNQESWSFLNWFRENHARDRQGKQRQRDATFSTAWQSLHSLTYVFEQGTALEERGFRPMPCVPYDGRNAHELVTQELGYVRGDKMDAIPDDIALPVLREAARWVEERTDDLIRLHREWLAEVEEASSAAKRVDAIQTFLKDFRFSNDPATGRPWTSFENQIKRVSSYGTTTLHPGNVPRRMVCDFIGACLIVLQGMTGMRPSDVASIQTLNQVQRGVLPSCIESKLSPDGLTEMFLLRGVEQKRTHEEHSWVLGERLTGAEDYPLPVKAVMALDYLLAPYREAAAATSLVITFRYPLSMAVEGRYIGSVNTTWFNNIQRDFIVNMAGIPVTPHKRGKEKTGFEFRSAQWRTTFAMFVIRTNKRALGPLAKHFHHADTLMTEHGYIGNDPELLQLVDDARVNIATNTLYGLISDAEAFAGGLRSHLNDVCSDLGEQINALTAADGLEMIRGMVLTHDLRLHFTDYGACGIAVTSSAARCHELAGRSSVGQVRPDFRVRRPSVCAGCRNFLISTEHLDYWKTRTEQLEAAKSDQQETKQWRLGRELALAKQFVRTLEQG